MRIEDSPASTGCTGPPAQLATRAPGPDKRDKHTKRLNGKLHWVPEERAVRTGRINLRRGIDAQ